MLYDNALLARVYLHGWQVTGRRALRAGLPRDPGLGAARDARARGRLLLGARRRLRGRGGPLLRLGRGRDARGPRPRAGIADEEVERLLGYWGVSPAGNFEGRNILHVPAGRRRQAAAEPRRRPARPARRAASSGCGRGWTTSASRSWNALMIAALADAGAALAAARTTWTPRRGCARFVLERAARLRRAPAAHLEGRRGDAQRLPRGPRLPARGAAAPLRGDLRGALVRRRARDRRRDDRALRRSRARRLLHDLARPRGADRPAQGPGRPSDPLGQLLGRARPAAPGGADRRAPLRGPRGRRAAPALAPRPSSTPTPSATCCRRSTSTSRPAREVALVAPGERRGAGRGARRARGGRPRRPPPPPRPRRRRRRAASGPSCCASARRSRAGPRPTSARTSPARRR